MYLYNRVHTIRKSQGKKYGFKGSLKNSGKVMKSQKILFKLEESQEKSGKFFSRNEFCGTQL